MLFQGSFDQACFAPHQSHKNNCINQIHDGDKQERETVTFHGERDIIEEKHKIVRANTTYTEALFLNLAKSLL